MFTKSNRSRLLAGLMFPALLALQACQNTDTVVFVTATDVGINADPTTSTLKIGYGRGDILIGPDYPTSGAAPNVFAYSNSNLSVFSPKIQQLYATGNASLCIAQLGTAETPPASAPNTATTAPLCDYSQADDTKTGERRPLFFGTGTNIGLHIGLGGAASKVKFGFNREEISVLPLHSQAPAVGSPPDKLPSVLASINMDQEGELYQSSGGSTPATNNTRIHVSEFFATGETAKLLAKNNQSIRELYIKTALLDANNNLAKINGALDKSMENIGKYFDTATASQFDLARTKLLSDPSLSQAKTQVAELQKATDKDMFLRLLKTSGNIGLIPILDDIAVSANKPK